MVGGGGDLGRLRLLAGEEAGGTEVARVGVEVACVVGMHKKRRR